MKLPVFIACAAALACSMSSQAAIVTYDFTVNGGSTGPLAGQTSSGYLSFDSSIAPTGGGIFEGPGGLIDLAFAWDGIAYTEATANTGLQEFNANGDLIRWRFGNNCNVTTLGSCGVSSNSTSTGPSVATPPTVPALATR